MHITLYHTPTSHHTACPAQDDSGLQQRLQEEIKHGGIVEALLAAAVFAMGPLLISFVIFSFVVVILMSQFKTLKVVG